MVDGSHFENRKIAISRTDQQEIVEVDAN